MKRKKKVLNVVDSLVEDREKPTAEKISAHTGFHPEDVHRLLNKLEIEGEVKSTAKTFNGNKIRIVQRIR